MKLCLINHSFKYELEKLIRIFLPFEKIEFTEILQRGDSTAVTLLYKGDGDTEASAKLYFNGKIYKKAFSVPNNHPDYENECELKLAAALYDCFVNAVGYAPEWGLLTGIRPAKLFSRLCESMGEKGAEEYFKNSFFVSDKKISLCKAAVKGEEEIISRSSKNSFSLYISIPFCPTRCSYCSFVSHSVAQAKRLVPAYIEKLCEEIRVTAQIAKENGLKLETVYVGGGTPTAVEAMELDRVLSAVKDSFDLSSLKEYTVEAGRPDTINVEKLRVIKDNSSTRISINPQSMNDGVLSAIGRRHTAEDTVKAFSLARSMGFSNINMDLIAGLPQDTRESFENTLEQILGLDPESVTVHSLSFKRASDMTRNGVLPEKEVGETASFMVDRARERLSEKGILPYYMYRQSKTVGNLENIGYAKKGYECLYNVYIMDETHTILACGASDVTKLREPGGSRIERIFNFKYPYEYIDRFDEIISRKDAVGEFYSRSASFTVGT